jgi:hypothetical protein
MSHHSFLWLRVAGAVIMVIAWVVPVDAQLYQVVPPRRYRKAAPSTPADTASSDTRISLEIFTGTEGVGYHAQQWESVFDHAGVLARIHTQMSGDKISIREKQYGKLREVALVGKLERDGSLTFPGHKFARSQSAAFEEWLRELKTYGAQGSPSGKELWGLSREQFDAMTKALAVPVEEEVAGLPLEDAIRALGLPEEYPFRFSVGAQHTTLAMPGVKKQPGRLQVRGISHGSALALVLSQYGLGFRPNRTPAGKLELVGLRTEDGQALWPIGWDIPEGTYPATVAPKLFQQTKVDLKDQKLMDVLNAIADRTGVPVRVDYPAIAARRLDLDTILVSASGEHMTWNRLLTTITTPSLLLANIRTDEAKKPFVWITSVKNAPPPRVKRAPRPKKPADADLFPEQ